MIDFTSQTAVDGEGGGHFDGAKPRVDLIPPWFIEGMGWVLAYGAHKYQDAENWKGGIRVSRLLEGSVRRHLLRMAAGEDIDPESRLPHWAHLAVDLMMAVWMIEERPDMDDRAHHGARVYEIVTDLAERGLEAVRLARYERARRERESASSGGSD